MRDGSILGLVLASVALLGLGATASAKEEPVKESAKESTGKSAEHAGNKEHKPSAIEHVVDPHEDWHIFHNQSFPVKIPLNWIKISKKFAFPSKFMILELVVAVLIAWIFLGLARRVENGEPPRGPFWNFFEWLLTFTRDQIAKPALGEHDADRFVPYLWTLGLFILFNNLLGMFPWMGSPTASIAVTGALALCSFVLIHGAAIAKLGLFHYLQSLWPHIDMPFFYGLGFAFGLVIKLMISVIEVFGTVIKCFVLAVRLFANMFAGHVVLATVLLFVVAARNMAPLGWASISAVSVTGVVALSLLELFVAFLQTYIFVFLTALFMGMAMHPQH